LTQRDTSLTLDDMSVVRSAALRGFRDAVTELGGDPEALAAAAGLVPHALDTDDLLVPDEAVAMTLEHAAATLRCPDLGLRVAARQDLGMLGPLAVAIQNSPTLGDALACTSRYLFVHGRSLSLTPVPDPYRARGVLGVRYGVDAARPVPAQAVDLGLGVLHRAITFLVGGGYGLRSVELPHRPVAPLASYEDFFGAAVRVNRPEAVLRVPRTMLEFSLTGVNDTLRRLAIAFLARQAPAPAATTAGRVRSALQQSLGTAAPDVGSVARLLSVHPRTLQRQLAAEGTAFGTILDEVRRQQAHRYLTTTDMPLTQVAALLGLSEQSALTRCCRRWWGCTPTAIRCGAPSAA
jgi:AraC-like DNA-binding protein